MFKYIISSILLTILFPRIITGREIRMMMVYIIYIFLVGLGDIYIDLDTKQRGVRRKRKRKRGTFVTNTMSLVRCVGTLFPKTSLFTIFLSLIVLSSFAIANASFHNLTTLPFNAAYSPLFGDSNVVRSDDDHSVRLLLDRFTGSPPKYIKPFFSSNIHIYNQLFHFSCPSFSFLLLLCTQN